MRFLNPDTYARAVKPTNKLCGKTEVFKVVLFIHKQEISITAEDKDIWH